MKYTLEKNKQKTPNIILKIVFIVKASDDLCVK